VAVTQSSSVATSILILISEVIHSKPGLVLNKEVTEQTVVTNNTGADESDDEHYEDVPLSDEEGDTVADSQPSTGSDNKKATVSWVHTKNIDTNRPKSSYYDPSARNPLFACAETTALWELDVMGRHFHPSTQMFAQKIVNNERIDYSGDPLVDFSVKQFLNRFVFRNPKKMDKRVKKSTRESRVFGRIPAPTTGDTGAVVADITSKDYVNQSESRVPVDELFIYNYLRQRQSMASAAKGDDSDAESVTSVEFESLLDRLEPMSKRERDLDFHKDLLSSKKSSKSKRDDDDSADEGSDGDSSADEDEFGDDSGADDEDMEFDADDPDFADAFDGIDEDLEEAFGDEDDDGSGDEDRDGKPAKRPKRNKKGFDSVTNSVFASADEFAELLEDNESDSDISGAEESAKGVGAKGKGKADRKAEFRAKRKLGRNHSKNKKRKKVNPKDLL
jgi:ribosome biogenesis protein MAK21